MRMPECREHVAADGVPDGVEELGVRHLRTEGVHAVVSDALQATRLLLGWWHELAVSLDWLAVLKTKLGAPVSRLILQVCQSGCKET
jgi:hypothetical protein